MRLTGYQCDCCKQQFANEKSPVPYTFQGTDAELCKNCYDYLEKHHSKIELAIINMFQKEKGKFFNPELWDHNEAERIRRDQQKISELKDMLENDPNNGFLKEERAKIMERLNT
jgi:hypothetical protein